MPKIFSITTSHFGPIRPTHGLAVQDLQHALAETRTVAQTCRYFGISRKTEGPGALSARCRKDVNRGGRLRSSVVSRVRSLSGVHPQLIILALTWLVSATY